MGQWSLAFNKTRSLRSIKVVRSTEAKKALTISTGSWKLWSMVFLKNSNSCKNTKDNWYSYSFPFPWCFECKAMIFWYFLIFCYFLHDVQSVKGFTNNMRSHHNMYEKGTSGIAHTGKFRLWWTWWTPERSLILAIFQLTGTLAPRGPSG